MLRSGIARKMMENIDTDSETLQKQKLEALGQFAGGIAHDFNNILSIIEGYARIMQKRVAEGRPLGDAIDKILSSTERGASLTRQLLAFSRRKIMVEEVCDLREIIDQQAAMLKPLLDSAIHLSISHAFKPVAVSCSHDAMAQILMNLALNARDAMPEEGGRIGISTFFCRKDMLPPEIKSQDEDFICLLVNDTGMGMEEETRRRAAEPFFTTKESGRGTGMGLSVVAGLVRQMRGAMSIESQPHRGTSVSIYLPLARSKKDKARQSVVEESEDMAGKTVLVVEDEDDLRQILAETLADMGFEVLTAANGNAALLVQDSYEGQIDFLLTDIVMPEMNGIRLAELAGSLRPEMRTVFISGYPAEGMVANIVLPENACILAKPVQPEDIRRAFAGKLKNPRWMPENDVAQWEEDRKSLKGAV